ncbi:MAG: LysM peptidoglycan-binding domain-containing protein [Chloroflexi bacterium]|nr:LysM peptidoglycan-binding domain-containing protein [Chloroflexota bacterium]
MIKTKRFFILMLVVLLSASMLTITSAAAASPASGPNIHIVQPGETLFSIAWHNGTTVQALMAANGLHSTLIYSGQGLLIPTAVAAAPPPAGNYIVQAGDTLYSIARTHGTSVDALMQANGLSNTWIWVGQALIIPNGSAPAPVAQPVSMQYYVVQWGDTLYSVAWRFGVPADALAQANGIAPDGWLYAGQRLIIPNGAHAPAPPAYGAPTAPAGPATYYICQPGDTLNSIAYRFNINPWALAQANGLSNNGWVYAGQQLVIPGVYQGNPVPPPMSGPSYIPASGGCTACPPPPPPCTTCAPPEVPPTDNQPPVVTTAWQGSVISNTNGTADTREFNSVIRVTMPGHKDWPVTVWALPIQDSTFHITGRTGTKPELGEYGVEFAPFKAGWYAVYPEGLDARVDIYLDGHGTIYLQFVQVSLAGSP